MANEGFLGKTSISGEKAATDDHPAIIHALPLDASVTAPLPAGTLMARVKAGAGYAYKPYVPVPAAKWAINYTVAEDEVIALTGALPCAVVNEPCDPTVEGSAKCVVHGCVKARLLKVGAVAADADAVEKLRQSGIFAV
ncbi:MAG: hypothetical protein LBC55_01265 [Desulfovibrio sp.]|jgi:hypothetical protein|nr:hypothetical protein [Desulfovibrio sp.]